MNKEPRDTHYWSQRLRVEKGRLDARTKLEIIKSFLVNTSSITSEEADTFLAPNESLANPDAIMEYAIVEMKVAKEFSCEIPANWENKDAYLRELRENLKSIYTLDEIDEIESYIQCIRDANAITVWLAGDHYGFRRIRNAYLPEITDVIENDTETGVGRDVTGAVFKEGPKDAVSRIERLLGIE